MFELNEELAIHSNKDGKILINSAIINKLKCNKQLEFIKLQDGVKGEQFIQRAKLLSLVYEFDRGLHIIELGDRILVASQHGFYIKDSSFIFYNTAFNSVILNDNVDMTRVKYLDRMFEHSNIGSIKFNNFKGIQITTTQHMFLSVNADEIDISNWYLPHLKGMERMFYFCKANKVDMSNLNIDNKAVMSEMFTHSNIECLDISKINLHRKAVNMAEMFSYSNIGKLIMLDIDTETANEIAYNIANEQMFKECNIKKVITNNEIIANALKQFKLDNAKNDSVTYIGI